MKPVTLIENFIWQKMYGGYVIDKDEMDRRRQYGSFSFESDKTKAVEKLIWKRKRQENPVSARTSARMSALDGMHQDAWEENRLSKLGCCGEGRSLPRHQHRKRFTSDVVGTPGKTHLFLMVEIVSNIRDAVPTIRDASSDFAKMAREGSATLRQLRANKDKNTMRQKFWKLANANGQCSWS
jgi:hypothetical protein